MNELSWKDDYIEWKKTGNTQKLIFALAGAMTTRERAMKKLYKRLVKICGEMNKYEEGTSTKKQKTTEFNEIYVEIIDYIEDTIEITKPEYKEIGDQLGD